MSFGKVAALAASVALLLAGCSSSESVPQAAPATAANPSMVAGLIATNGPNTVNEYGPRPSREVIGTDGGPVDTIAIDSLSDLEEFWGATFSEYFEGSFQPVELVQSWDSTKHSSQTFCGEETFEYVNAAFGVCNGETIIGWDRGVLMHDLREFLGDVGITAVLAHEYGHWLHYQTGTAPPEYPTIVKEQQADCYAGVYMRWVAEGKSKRVTMSTGDGLNNVLAAIIAVRDPIGTANEADPRNEHGSAFDRVSAFQFGFEDGVPACRNISMREISQRRADLPQFLDVNETGEMDLTEESVRQVVDALNVVAPVDEVPAVRFGTDGCSGSPTDAAVSYCPDDNAIVANLEALNDMTAMPEKGFVRGPALGDTTAFSAVMSRYMLSHQRQRDATLEGDDAALRTACLTGAVMNGFVQPVTTPDGNTLRLSAGDLDEAVSGLLVNGVVASDVAGNTVPAGFVRIEAFRDGVLGDVDHCYDVHA